MRTGLTKKQKTTAIYFDEYSSMIEVQTHNTGLKKRLTAFAKEYPQCCRQTDDDERGGLTFEIEKGRLSFRLTAPYSEERKRTASEWAKQNGIAMEQETIQSFRNTLRRIYAKENSEKYISICTKTRNDDEERIWQLCIEFWHPDYAHRTSDSEKYVPNPDLDNATAKSYLKELTQLLDRLGWYKES